MAERKEKESPVTLAGLFCVLGGSFSILKRGNGESAMRLGMASVLAVVVALGAGQARAEAVQRPFR